MISLAINRLFGTSCAVVALAAMAPAAFAQEAPNATAAAEQNEEAGAVSTNDIVVTARRREESIQTVPVAVTAVTSQALTQNNIQTTIDLQRMVPGVVFSGAGTEANTTLTIRGQGKDVIGPGLPSVILYFNEVPLPGFGSSLPTYDIASVQVLKGPQGTLFGRNTTGGALLTYSQTPTDRWEGYAQVTLGDYYWRSVQGALNIPITDGVALRVAGNRERRAGYTKNLGIGSDFDVLHSDAFRVSLKLNPTDWIENTTVYDYFLKSGPYIGVLPTGVAGANPAYRNPSGLVGTVGVDGVAAINAAFNCTTSVNCSVDQMVARQLATGPRAVYSDVDAFDHTRLQGISNTTKINLGTVTFKNIFGWRKTDVDQQGNTDGVPVPLINTALTRHDAQISDEIQFAGSLFKDKLDFLFGAFYLRTRPTGSISLFSDFLRPPSIPISQWRLSTVGNTLYRDESKAVFGSLNYHFSGALEGLSLSAALRYTWDTQGVCSVTRGGATTPVQSTAECRSFSNAFDRNAKFEKLTWTFGADYKVNNNIFTYAVARRGYRSGGINPPNLGGLLVDFQNYKPQTVDDIEVGVKTNWRAGDFSGRFNVAAFRGIYNDLQRQIAGIPANLDGDNNPANDPASTALIVNGARARIQGVEVDGVISPTRDLSFTFGGSYLNPKYLSLQNPAILSGVATGQGIFLNLPKTSFNVGARYKLPFELSGATFTLSGDYYWTDGYQKGIVAYLPSYDVANARIEVNNIGGSDLSATFFVDNIFDKAYLQSNSLSGSSPGTTTFSYGPPRMYGVRLRFAFGQ